jgi:hypothetical protein
MTKKHPETILREALEVARDEMKRVNDHYSCVRPDPFGVVIQALHDVPALPPIPHASDVEKRIVGKVVELLLEAGYSITVNDGEDDTVEKSRDPVAIFPALCSTDADTLFVSLPGARTHFSFVLLVWGNDCDVISNYGMSLDAILKPANDLADELEG